MDSVDVLKILEETGAMSKGHFRLTSGRHSNLYFQCARLMQHPDKAELVCRELVSLLGQEIVGKVDVVVGPATGAILMAYEVARALGPQVRAIFSERENGVMTIRHGFSLSPGERVLVVEDVVTTGGSVQELLDVVSKHEANPVGVGVILDRSNGKVTFDNVPFRALVALTTEIFEPETCPLCKQGLPIAKPGSRQL